MFKHKILFVASHNGFRSFMAEAFLNHRSGDRFEAESAGFRAGNPDPLAVRVMREEDISITREQTKTEFSLYTAGRAFERIVSICDWENNEKSPIYPGHREYIDWDMCDPDRVEDEKDRLTAMRINRDQIKARVLDPLTRTRARPGRSWTWASSEAPNGKRRGPFLLDRWAAGIAQISAR